jgi:ATP-dependent helicase HrpA
MTDLGLGDPLQFPFIDRPASKAVHDGYDTLVELGAVKKGTQYYFPNLPPAAASRYELTETGRAMARMQVDPRLSRMLIEARAEKCLPEVSVLAAALSTRDPRERPPDKAQQADAVHAAFKHPDSDFLVLLNIWNRYHGDFERLGSLVQKRRFCHENFLSFPRMREWTYLHAELEGALDELELRSGPGPGRRGKAGPRRGRGPQRGSGEGGAGPEKNSENSIVSPILHADISPTLYGAIHRSILSGYLSNIAAHKEKNVYAAAKNREVTLWPGSVLFGKGAGWIVSTEVVRTSRLFARTVAKIDPAWLERLGGPLCKRSYSDAAWDRGRGEVTAKERVTLFGLEIVRERRVSYGRVNPAEAHEIFVMNALVEGEIDDPPPFLVHNLELQRKLEAMEQKLRRRDILVADGEIAKFYSEKLPGIHDVRTLRKLLKDVRDRGGDDSFLRLREEDLLNYQPDEAAVASFPDKVEIAGRPFRAVYKFAPGEEDDGVTLTVPPELLSAIPAERLEWGVAGQYRDKIEALIKGLPKRYRKLLVPVGEKAGTIARDMPQAPEDVPLFKAVADFVKKRFGVEIPAREWALADVPRHLRMRVAVVEPSTGRVIDAGRDVELLRKKLGAADQAPSKMESPAWQEARRTWEKSGLTEWSFGDLPEKIAVGTSLTAYPALQIGDTILFSEFPASQTPPSKTGGTMPVSQSPDRGRAASGTSPGPAAGAGTISIRLFPARAEAEAAHKKGVRALLLRKFAKDLTFVRRYHKIPAELDRTALYFGGREALERAIEEALARDVFERNIRTEAEFKAYEAEVGRTLFDKGHALTQTAIKIVELHAKLRAELAKGSGGGASSPAGAKAFRSTSLNELSRFSERVKPEYLDTITADLDRLVPESFLEIYPVARLTRIPRYVEGLIIRLERARLAPDKDKAKMAQLEPYTFELTRLEAARRAPKSGTQYSFPISRSAPSPEKRGHSIVSPISDEKRAAVDDLRWMIEEFKLSLFAPEIKTAFPISAVRLARKIAEIDALA